MNSKSMGWLYKCAHPLTIVLILAMVIRALILFLFAWDSQLHFETVRIAEHIVAGEGYSWNWYDMIPLQPTATFPPLYTYFVALILTVFRNPARAILFAQAILNSLGVIPMYSLGRRLRDTRVGLMMALLYAVFPEMAFSPTKMVAEPVVLPVVAFSIFLFIYCESKIREGKSPLYFICLGTVLGIGALLKANVTLIFFSYMIGLALLKLEKRLLIRSAVFMAAGFFLIISPWSVRSSILYKKPVLLRSMYGYNLWRGNHPGATGTGRLDTNNTSEAGLDSAYMNYIEINIPDREGDVDSFFMNEALRFIKGDIPRFLKLTAKRLLYFITVDPTHPLTKNPIYLLGYVFALVFGIWGGILLARSGTFNKIFIIIPSVLIVFYAPVMVLPRYRLYGILVLLILSAIPLEMIGTKLMMIFKFNIDERGQQVESPLSRFSSPPRTQ